MGFGDLSRVNTNIQSLSAFKSLQQTNQQMNEHRLRLATGMRINRAEDDSAGYSIGMKLKARIGGQSQALSNIGDAKSMLTVAEGSMSSVMDILQTMKEKAVQAANDTLGEDERNAINSQLDALRSEISDTLSNTSYNGKKLFSDSSSKNFTFQVGAENGDTFKTSISELDTEELNIEESGHTLYEDINSGWGGGSSASNYSSASVSIDKSSYNGDSGDIKLDYKTSTSATATFDVTKADGSTTTVDFDVSSTNASATVDGLKIKLGNSGTTVSDASNFFDKDGDDMSLSLYKEGLNVSDATKAGETISNIDAGISEINDQISKLGDAQSRLSFKQSNLQTSMNNNEAARSRIMDADFAKEQMEIAKMQILQQTGTSSLAQANAAPQSILSLFG